MWHRAVTFCSEEAFNSSWIMFAVTPQYKWSDSSSLGVRGTLFRQLPRCNMEGWEKSEEAWRDQGGDKCHAFSPSHLCMEMKDAPRGPWRTTGVWRGPAFCVVIRLVSATWRTVRTMDLLFRPRMWLVTMLSVLPLRGYLSSQHLIKCSIEALTEGAAASWH